MLEVAIELPGRRTPWAPCIRQTRYPVTAAIDRVGRFALSWLGTWELNCSGAWGCRSSGFLPPPGLHELWLHKLLYGHLSLCLQRSVVVMVSAIIAWSALTC
jgi:hypothetical protein